MLTWLVGSSLRLGRLMVAAAVALIAVGVVQLRGAAVDVYPEFGAPAIQVQAEALGLSATEVEQLITVPLEQDLLNGVPWLKSIRSRSMPGLSAIDLAFEPGTDVYQARQMVAERMTQAKALPNVGTPPIMVQPMSSTSRVAMISLTSRTVSPIQMSVLARWQIRPRLMSIPGVANVSIWGQRDRQLQVQVDPGRLAARKVTLTQLIESTGNALWVSPLSFVEASTPGTGGFVETPNQRLGVQHVSPITTSKQLAEVAIEGNKGPAKRIGDVAKVVEDHQPLIGDAADRGQLSVMLVVDRFPDANTAHVTRDVEAAMAAMAPGLTGITVNPQVFRPATFLEKALDNLGVAGLIGLLLLVALALLLMSWRMALTTIVPVLLSLIAAAYVLHLVGATLTVMTLVGIAAALTVVVDNAVGGADHIYRRLRDERGDGATSTVAVMTTAVVQRSGPLCCATACILLAAAPLLLLDGVPGALAPHVVLSYVLALLASLVVALTVTPTLALLVLGGRPGAHRRAPLAPLVQRVVDRIVTTITGRPAFGLASAVLLALVGVVGVSQAGSGAGLPAPQDRTLLVRLQTAPGTSLTEMDRVSAAVASELQALPGVRSAGFHVGRAVGAGEIVDVDASEVWVSIATDADYRPAMRAIRETVRGFPGLRSTVRTYSDDRVAAADASTPGDLVVRVYGPDLATLRHAAEGVQQVLTTIEGVLAPRVQPLVSEPTVEIEVNLSAAQRYGLRPGDVRREASTLISGLTVGSLYEQQKIFDVVVWGGPPTRHSVSSLQSLVIDTPRGHVRLGDVASVRIARNPVAISHDAVSRSLDVTAAVRGRDASDVARDVTGRLRGLSMPMEYRAEVLGDAASAENDARNVGLAALAAALVIILLLQAATRSWRSAAILVICVPLAGVGGVVVAPIVGGVRSLGVLAGLFAVLALALQQGLALVGRAQMLRQDTGRAGRMNAVLQATREKAAPVLFTALTAAAVLAPLAVMGTRAGTELLHPLAVTVLAGLVSSTVTVLFVLPTLYAAFGSGSSPEAVARIATEDPAPLKGML